MVLEGAGFDVLFVSPSVTVSLLKDLAAVAPVIESSCTTLPRDIADLQTRFFSNINLRTPVPVTWSRTVGLMANWQVIYQLKVG